MFNNLRASFQKILYYPSAIAGVMVILLLVVVSIYTMVTIPYSEAISLWRGGEDAWYQNPKFAPPAWINLFSSKKYSESFAVSTADAEMQKTVTPSAGGVSTVDMAYEFDFSSDVYPQDMLIYFKSKFKEKQPFVSIELITPDDRTIRIANLAIVGNEYTYRFSQDEKLRTKLRTEDSIQALFSLPDTEQPL